MPALRSFADAVVRSAGSLAFVAVFACVAPTFAQDEAPAPPAVEETAPAPETSAPEASDSPQTGPTPDAADAVPAKTAPQGMIKLNPKGTVQFDKNRKLVVVDGRIALRAGLLEMFACPAGTKEHESIIALDSDSMTIHTALLAIGARAGGVVKWDPEYKPAWGDVIEVYVLWKDADGKPHRVRGQSWVKDVKTGEEMKSDWIFAGSGFWTDPADGMRYYYADGGEAICVSNFPTAMLDLPIQSSQANDSLLFEAFESRIPARGTPVRVVLRMPPNPDFEKRREAAETGEASAAPAEDGAPDPEAVDEPSATPPTDEPALAPDSAPEAPERP